MDGWDAARKLREEQVKAKILALTASMMQDNEKDLSSHLFDAVLIKPLTVQHLNKTLKCTLSKPTMQYF